MARKIKTVSIELVHARNSKFANQNDPRDVKRRRCPKYLAKRPDVKRVWLQSEKLLREAGIMCEIYYMSFEVLVGDWLRWAELDRFRKAEEKKLSADDKKVVHDRISKAWAGLEQLCRDFGGYPSARSGITFIPSKSA